MAKPNADYDFDDVYDSCECPDCKGFANVVETGGGFFVHCPNCGRILRETKETVEEAVFAFKDRGETDYE